MQVGQLMNVTHQGEAQDRGRSVMAMITLLLGTGIGSGGLSVRTHISETTSFSHSRPYGSSVGPLSRTSWHPCCVVLVAICPVRRPQYFRHVCLPTVILSGRVGLRSASRGDLAERRTATELRKDSFHISAPAIWNTLSDHQRSPSISNGQCRCGPKNSSLPASLREPLRTEV